MFILRSFFLIYSLLMCSLSFYSLFVSSFFLSSPLVSSFFMDSPSISPLYIYFHVCSLSSVCVLILLSSLFTSSLFICLFFMTMCSFLVSVLMSYLVKSSFSDDPAKRKFCNFPHMFSLRKCVLSVQCGGKCWPTMM